MTWVSPSAASIHSRITIVFSIFLAGRSGSQPAKRKRANRSSSGGNSKRVRSKPETNINAVKTQPKKGQSRSHASTRKSSKAPTPPATSPAKTHAAVFEEVI